ncbi:hypothetical protein NXY07_10055 [Phocaeicola dorei]|nr:hypothetical protein [Phocaeicola dorei]
MRLDNDRKADFRTENPRSAFSFLAVKIAVSRADCARRPFQGLGWLKENHPRFAPVFSFAKPCRNPRQTGRKDTKK